MFIQQSLVSMHRSLIRLSRPVSPRFVQKTRMHRSAWAYATTIRQCMAWIRWRSLKQSELISQITRRRHWKPFMIIWEFFIYFYRGWGADPGQSDFEIRFRVPRTNTIANYKATMKFFGLPISGQGVQNTTMSKWATRAMNEISLIIVFPSIFFVYLHSQRVSKSIWNWSQM